MFSARHEQGRTTATARPLASRPSGSAFAGGLVAAKEPNARIASWFTVPRAAWLPRRAVRHQVNGATELTSACATFSTCGHSRAISSRVTIASQSR